MISDKSIGRIFLVLSCIALIHMFFHLMVVPILPLSDDNFLKLSPPTVILSICGIFGFTVIGTLLCYTLFILYSNQIRSI